MQATPSLRTSFGHGLFTRPFANQFGELLPFRMNSLTLRFALFLASIACYCLSQTAGAALGPANIIVAAMGSACGFSWLLSRSLFRGKRDTHLWPWVLVGFILASAAGLKLFDIFGSSTGALGAIDHALLEAHLLASSAALLLTFIEPINGFRRSLPKPERLFRMGFLALYGTLIFAAVLLADQANPALGTLSFEVKFVSALVSVLGASAAVWYRLSELSQSTELGEVDESAALATRIEALLQADGLYRHRDLKVADLANRLGVPDYKVTKAITGALGQPNFNRLVNGYRIAYAKTVLENPERRLHSVLSIALESGFSSIGPFNKAFKEQVGQSPGRYRERVLAAL